MVELVSAGIASIHERAVDILWTNAGPDMHRLFRDQRGWSADEYRARLADAIERMLLP